MDSRTQRDEQNFCLPSESNCETFDEKGFFKIPSNKLVSARKILPQESFGHCFDLFCFVKFSIFFDWVFFVFHGLCSSFILS